MFDWKSEGRGGPACPPFSGLGSMHFSGAPALPAGGRPVPMAHFSCYQLERRLPEKKGLDGSGAVWYNQSRFSHAPVVKLADTMDLGSIPATGRGSSPLGRTSSGIFLTAALPAPKGRKAPPDGKFLRLHLRSAPLGSQVIFLRGTEDQGRGFFDALPAPKGRKAPPDGKFLRFHLRSAPLGSQVIFLRGTKDQGRGD